MDIIDEHADPGEWSWEHRSLRFYSDPPKVWTSASQVQMEAVRDLERIGFECAALTPLADGSMYMMFKRAIAPEEAAQEAAHVEDRAGVEVGFRAPVTG